MIARRARVLLLPCDLRGNFPRYLWGTSRATGKLPCDLRGSCWRNVKAAGATGTGFCLLAEVRHTLGEHGVNVVVGKRVDDVFAVALELHESRLLEGAQLM